MFLKQVAGFTVAGLMMMSISACGIGGSLTVPAGSSRPDGFKTFGGDITIEDGATIQKGDLSTVKGAIMVGDNASVNGIDVTNGSISIGDNSMAERVSTGSGDISVGDNSTVRSLEAGKGSITVGAGSTVANNVKTGSGSITIGDGSSVTGYVESTRGQVTLDGAKVGGNVIAHAKGLHIDNGATVAGYVHFKKAAGVMEGKDVPVVILGKNINIAGTVTFDRDVKLYVHDSATTGDIAGAEPMAYSGDEPDMDSVDGEASE